MAGVFFSAQVEVAVSTSTKTLVQLYAATDHRALVHEVGISFNGITASEEPVRVELVRQTNAGTMGPLTLQKINESDSETLQSTAKQAASGEPTGSNVVWGARVHPQSGLQWKPRIPIVVPGNSRLGLRVTATTDVDAMATLLCEE
jgi:hypothetical protein